jgi:acyl-CoA synthetase (NDP forming)
MLSASRLALTTAARRTAVPAMGAVRNLNVHEYISMELMKNHGIKTPECYVASTPDEAENIFMNSLNKGKSTLSAVVHVREVD